MRYISKRAAIEKSTLGVGVSVATRKYWRAYWQQRGVAQMLGNNAFINDAIAGDFNNGQPLHRFILKSGEIAEIRKSQNFYYVAAMRSPGQYDVIVIQPRYKESDPEVSKQRLTEEWIQQQQQRGR